MSGALLVHVPISANADLTRIIRHGSVLCAADRAAASVELPARRGPRRHPPRSVQLVLDPGLGARGGVVAAVAAVLGHAQQMAARLDQDPVHAVHEIRRSLRRTRAVVQLLREHLPAQLRRTLLTEVRAVLRATSPMRDLQVMKDTLGTIPASPKSEPARAALTAMLETESQRRAMARRRNERLRAHMERIHSLPVRLRAALPESLASDDLCSAMIDSYRRARRAGERARETRDPDAVHSWRKRIKELNYQTELIEPLDGRVLGRMHKELGLAARRLGKVTDLKVLGEAVRVRTTHLPPEAGAVLLQEIIRRRDRKTERALKRLRQLFDMRPKRLHAVLTA